MEGFRVPAILVLHAVERIVGISIDIEFRRDIHPPIRTEEHGKIEEVATFLFNRVFPVRLLAGKRQYSVTYLGSNAVLPVVQGVDHQPVIGVQVLNHHGRQIGRVLPVVNVCPCIEIQLY